MAPRPHIGIPFCQDHEQRMVIQYGIGIFKHSVELGNRIALFDINLMRGQKMNSGLQIDSNFGSSVAWQDRQSFRMSFADHGN